LELRSPAKAFETAFWVWQRSEPLSEPEQAELAAQNIRTIYWQIGELENVGKTWRWKARFNRARSEPDGPTFVPVVRLESREKSPFLPAALESLLSALSSVTKDADELQLDYDAPDRLGDYAAALRKFHTVVPRLSITALPGWSRHSAWRIFDGSVDELVPMLTTSNLIRSCKAPLRRVAGDSPVLAQSDRRQCCLNQLWRLTRLRSPV
jgi:hypothetical protein